MLTNVKDKMYYLKAQGGPLDTQLQSDTIPINLTSTNSISISIFTLSIVAYKYHIRCPTKQIWMDFAER